MYLAKILASRVVKAFRKIKSEAFKDDTEETDVVQPFGFEGVPIKDMIALVAETSELGRNQVIGYIHKNVLAAAGESRMFSLDVNGTVKAYTWCKANGDLLLNGDSNFAVKFNELKTEYNSLKATVNDIAQKWSDFANNYAPGSPSTTGLPATLAGKAVAQNTSNIDNAKNTNIKTS